MITEEAEHLRLYTATHIIRVHSSKSKPIKTQIGERISITCKLPEKENFKGLNRLLKSKCGNSEKPINAIVEFSRPKLEIGSVPTKCEE